MHTLSLVNLLLPEDDVPSLDDDVEGLSEVEVDISEEAEVRDDVRGVV